MKYVSINGHVIRANAVNGTDDPPIRIARTKADKKPTYAHELDITGPARLTYNPKTPQLACGARLVLECRDVKVIR